MTDAYKFKWDQWDILINIGFQVVDESKFTEEMVEETLGFWGKNYRDTIVSKAGGDVRRAFLMMVSAACVEKAAFNNFLDEEYVMYQFDWSKDQGVEGFPSFDEAGIKLVVIDNLHVEASQIEVVE